MYLVPIYLLTSYWPGAESSNGSAKRHSVDPHAENLADDVSLPLTHGAHMQAKTERLFHIARTAGLEINVIKTKRKRINASQEAPLNVDGQAIEEIDR